MIKIALALFLIWQLAVILYQFWEPFRKKLARLQFYLCGLLPAWQMFGPDPIDGDFLVFYRTAPENDATDPRYTEWELVDYDKKPMLAFSLFFNPRGNFVKALREICQETVKASSDRNVFYQLLLNDLIHRCRVRQSVTTDQTHQLSSTVRARLLQFQIRWQTPTAVTPIFSSHAHPY